jgi:hypothetical protein
MPRTAKSSVPLTGIEKLAPMYAKGSLSPGFDAALKASRAWSDMGAAGSFKAAEEAANKVTLAGSMRPEVQRAFERGLPSKMLAGGLDPATLAAEWASTGGIAADLNSRVVDAARALISTAAISGRVRADAVKMADGWRGMTWAADLYSPARAARLVARMATFPVGSALLADKYSFGGPRAQQALAELTSRQFGVLPAFSHHQAQGIAEQHLSLMPKWAVTEMVKMRAGPADLARLGAPRAGRDPTTTLRELAMRHGIGAIKPFEFNAGLIASAKAIDYPMPTLSRSVVTPAPERTRDIEPLPRPAVARPRPQRQLREDHEVAPVAASFFAGRDRQLVVSLLDTAELEEERQHLEALEERLRAGNLPARNHAAVSARQLLLGVANYCLPARREARPCRFGCEHCPHQLGADDVKNRIIAFVDERLRSGLEAHEFKIFVAHADYVFRWGARGTHQNCSAPEVVKAFVRLLEVLAVVARAAQVQHPARLSG